MDATLDADHLVKHRDGWCISSEGFFPPEADAVATLCGHVVNLPFGYRRGAPDCPHCVAARRATREARPTLSA